MNFKNDADIILIIIGKHMLTKHWNEVTYKLQKETIYYLKDGGA